MNRYEPRKAVARHWCRRAALGGILFFAARAHLAAQETPPPDSEPIFDLKAYEAELDRCAEAGSRPGEARAIRDSLPAEWKVREGSATIAVSTDKIKERLREVEVNPKDTEKAVTALRARIHAMRLAAEELEKLPEGNPAAAKKKLGEILARREFRDAGGPSEFEAMLTRLSRWIDRQLMKLFRRLNISAKTGNRLAWTVIGLAFVALCYMVWRWLSDKSRKPEAKADATLEPLDAREWVAEAMRAAERGDYREAIHCSYWAAIARLEAMNLLKQDRARTPRESLRLLTQYPKEETVLRGMTRRFELVWYGNRPASADDWSGTREELERMGCLKGSTAATANS